MLTHFSITQQGQRHIEKQEPCQDYSVSCRVHINRLDCDLVLAAVSDGVGSCEFSQYGAKTAVMSLISCIQDSLTENTFTIKDENIYKIFEYAFNYALEQVERIAEEKELPFLEFDSTLTGVIYDGYNLWFGHIGDDGLVVLYTDGTYEMVSLRHKGEEAHSVVPLRNIELWQFGKAPKDVASFALMTDGVLDYCVDSIAMNNRVYFPFLEPALTVLMDSDEKANCQKSEWNDFFSGVPTYADNFRTKVTDDISFVIVQNSDAVISLPEVKFDFMQWEADSARRRKELNDALYADYREYKAKTSKNGTNINLSEQRKMAQAYKTASKASTSHVTSSAVKKKEHLSSQAITSRAQPAKQDAMPSDCDTASDVVLNVLDEAIKVGYSAGKKVRESLFQTGKDKVPSLKNNKSSEQSSMTYCLPKTQSKNKESGNN